MSRVDAIIRQKAIAECIAAVHPLMDVDGDPGPVAHAMLAELKRLLGETPPSERIDYHERAQERARAAHVGKFTREQIGPEYRATATVTTPLGELQCETWLRRWTGPKRARVTWASEFTLDAEFVSVREIKSLGLAQRPTTRNRQKRSEDI